MPERELYRNQITRLVSSQVLHGSESLCRLLQYLAKHVLEHPNTPLKEYQLATEVFGRRSDFDPQSDSTIRVQAGRLRLKLAEYYSSEGAHDAVIVELPKGTYILSFHLREAAAKPAVQAAAVPSEDGKVPRSWLIAVAALSALLLLAVVTIGMIRSSRPSVSTAHAGTLEPPLAFRMFWKPFISGPDEPWLIFSNAAFVGRPETGMRYSVPTAIRRTQSGITTLESAKYWPCTAWTRFSDNSIASCASNAAACFRSTTPRITTRSFGCRRKT
jgi:hypothetical protein